MRDILAERLLALTMEWSPEEINEEIPLLQAIAEFKYNEYLQFSSGVRFIESLVRWLQKFESVDERKIAYQFFKDRLIFISSDQISYLVNIAFTDKINPILIKNTANEIQCNPYRVVHVLKNSKYTENLRKTLFIALSDGSKIDILRRVNRLSNEQVLTTYDISESKAKELSDELVKSGQNSKFSTIFLIDDFTGSGKSYFRIEGEEVKGKIARFLNKIFIDKRYENLFDEKKLHINVLFYVATEFALNTLVKHFNAYQQKAKLKFDFTVDAVQVIDSKIRDIIISDEKLLQLCEKYFDDSIIDSSYKKGDVTKPYLGFDAGALSIVFFHNTPNNSLPILWLPENNDEKLVGLFPRITRHRDEH